MTNLSKKLGDMEYDGLITNLIPDIQTAGGTIAKGSAAVTLERGTVLAKSSSTGKLSILGTSAGESDTLTADCILCDDVEVGTDADVTVPVYTAGCFDPEKVIVAESYTITEADKDELRKRGIVFKAASPAV